MSYYPPPNWQTAAPPRDKSVGAALVLTLFFGPLGLFYLGAVPGFVGLFILIPLALVGGFFTFGIASFLVWFGTIVWASVRAGRCHSEFQTYLARGARY
jgi:hypothetical protein